MSHVRRIVRVAVMSLVVGAVALIGTNTGVTASPTAAAVPVVVALDDTSWA